MENSEQKFMKMEISFEKIKVNGQTVTEIKNCTPYAIIISEKPIHPKRTPKDVRIIQSDQYVIIDGWDLDFERICLSIVK